MADNVPARTLLIPGSTNAEIVGAVLEEREMRYNLDTDRIHVGDGNTPGGFIFPTLAEVRTAMQPYVVEIVGYRDAAYLSKTQAEESATKAAMSSADSGRSATASNQAAAKSDLARIKSEDSANQSKNSEARSATQAAASAKAAEDSRIHADTATDNLAKVIAAADSIRNLSANVFASRDAALMAAGISASYATKAAMAAAPLPAADALVQVLTDETGGYRRAIYQNKNGVMTRVWLKEASRPQTLWFGSTGNDDGADGSKDRPFRTRQRLMAVAQAYDTVKFLPATVITENWNMTVEGNPLDNVPLSYDCTDGVVWQQMNNLMAVWTPAGAAYPNVWSATVVHSFGATDGSFMGAGQGFGPQMLIDQARLIEKQLTANVAEGNQYATEAEALAAVQATKEGAFYVRGKNGSNMNKGWQAGEQTYFVRCPDGTSPAGHLVNVGDRMAPIFGEGSKLRGKITIFGGIGHNGVIWRGCDVEDADVLYPCHHAQFCLGAHLKRVWVRHGNRTHGGYAWHDFGGSGTFLNQDTILEDCGTSDYYDAGNTMFGIHGTDDNISPYVGRQLVTRNFKAYNVASIGLGGGNHRFGSVHYDMTAVGVNTIDLGTSFEAYNLRVIASHLSPPVGSLFGGGGQGVGAKGRIEGGFSIGASAQIGFAVSSMDVVFINHHILLDADYNNGRWLQANTGKGPVNLTFERCVLEAVNTPMSGISIALNNQLNITMRDCHVSGLNFIAPANQITVVDPGTIYGGKSGLYVGGDGGLATAPVSTVRHLGYDVIDAANSFLGQGISILSSKGLFYAEGQGLQQPINSWVPPSDVKLNGIGRAGNNEVIYGNGGTVFRVGRMDPTPGNVVRVAGAPVKNFTGGISGVENFYDSDFFLLGEDGSITQYRPQNDAFTPRNSPIAYPLRGGTYNHNASGQVIAHGDGGVIVSTDFGVTWAQSIAQGDGTDFAGMYDQVTCCGWANGQFFLWCKNGILMTSATAAKGSWVRQYLPLPFAYVRSMAVDMGKGLGICIADMAGNYAQKTTRSQSVVRLNINDPDPTKWRILDVIESPLSATSKVLHMQNAAVGQNIFCFVGKVAQVAISDTGQSGRVSGRAVGFNQPAFTGYRDRERTKALQPR